jgi:hypothetical protein
MINCCENITFVGCFGSCELIPLLIDSDYTGSATMKFDWLGKTYSYDVIVEDGEQVVIPNIFNERSSVIFKLQKTDGSFFALPLAESESGEDAPVSECFYLQNSLQINISNISSGNVPTPGNLQVETTVFQMPENEDTVNIGALAQLPFQLYINGVLQTRPDKYTLNGSVVTIVDPPLDFPYEITIITYSYS